MILQNAFTVITIRNLIFNLAMTGRTLFIFYGIPVWDMKFKEFFSHQRLIYKILYMKDLKSEFPVSSFSPFFPSNHTVLTKENVCSIIVL
jgi:hypothetical protein